ncbi:MAG: hypothetical protein Ta2D_04390 [Rickettsiales bacterium]|nr:MAG: hypothetical protein Ta2D_04390 [Rickettsiales bacterium]
MLQAKPAEYWDALRKKRGLKMRNFSPMQDFAVKKPTLRTYKSQVNYNFSKSQELSPENPLLPPRQTLNRSQSSFQILERNRQKKRILEIRKI